MGLPSWRRAKHHLPMRHTQLPRILQRIYAAIALLLFMAVFGTLGFYSVADEQADLVRRAAHDPDHHHHRRLW